MVRSAYSMVEEAVEALPAGSFVRGSDIAAPSGPVDTALSRLCAAERLTRVRKGLYWKGEMTPFGVSVPSVADVALEVAGPGSGPAGIAAAHWLGLTTQVPSVFVTAVPIRSPKAWPPVRFSQRSFGRRLRALWSDEVALIEVLRSGPETVERPWSAVGEVAVELVEKGAIRPRVLAEQIEDEPHRDTRRRWRQLVASNQVLADLVGP